MRRKKCRRMSVPLLRHDKTPPGIPAMHPRAVAALAALIAALAAPALGQPQSAVSSKEKMETCKFGAQEQKLKGKAEQDFIRKCMANEPAPKASKSTKQN